MAGLTSLLGVTGIIATFVVSPREDNEHAGVANLRATLSLFVPGRFFAMGIFQLVHLNKRRKTWPFATLCPLGLALLV